jgi:hypothetical protein
MTACEACGAADAGATCGACGETAESRQSVEYCAISILDKCSACGLPMPIDGPVLALHCGACQKTAAVKPSFWTLLETVRVDSLPGAGPTGFSRNFRTDVHHQTLAPACPACARPLSAATVPNGADGTQACPGCGAGFDTYPAPAWLREVVPQAAQVFLAARHTSGGEASELPDDTKPVMFNCPACAGALKITAKHQRVSTCEFCGAECYLPDALWLRLHPPKVRSTWYVRFHDPDKATALATARAERQREREAERARHETVIAELAPLRGTDPDAGTLDTFFAVTTSGERDLARWAIERAIASEWAVDDTARCVLQLREFLADTRRETALLRKLEVLIAERDGARALALLERIKVSGRD